MYICTDCKKRFFNPDIRFEKHGLDSPPYERFMACPYCKGENIKVIEVRHCRCCGARLRSDNRTDYCNKSCKKRGEKLWQMQEKNRLKREGSPIFEIMRKLKKYNEENKTDLSYGRFVATVLKT